MRNSAILTMLLLVFFRPAAAVDCESYTGTRADTTKEATTEIGKALTALKARNPKGLFAISSHTLLLLRRSVTSGADGRIGNVRLPLRARDIDSSLNIHVGDQVFTEFADHALFDALNTNSAITVGREVCEGARHCDDALPPSEEVPFLMKDLLQCNQSGKGVFVFSDGLFVTDMQLIADKIPVGSALFFAKEPSGYRLAGLIIQH
jgi:hypothetical protein